MGYEGENYGVEEEIEGRGQEVQKERVDKGGIYVEEEAGERGQGV